MKKAPVLGIIGGMGARADARFLTLLCDAVKGTEAEASFPNAILDCDPSRPDRTACFLRKDSAALAESLICSARRLKGAGAEYLAMPCNTAHYLYPYLRKQISLPFISMIRETAKNCAQRGLKTVGLIATRGCVSSCIYETELNIYGIRCIPTSPKMTEQVHNAIYAVKHGELPLEPIKKATEALLARGCEAIVLGCTELSITVPYIADSEHDSSIYVDSLDILASACVKHACEYAYASSKAKSNYSSGSASGAKSSGRVKPRRAL